MSKAVITNIVVSGLVCLIFLSTYHFSVSSRGGNDKIGYVKIGVLLSNSEIMQEADARFQRERTIALSNIDTLRQRVIQLQASADNTPDLEKAKMELQYYSQKAESELSVRHKGLNEEALKRINSFIEEYGKERGYRIILGATSEGSILYGQADEDITDELLASLNGLSKKDSK